MYLKFDSIFEISVENDVILSYNIYLIENQSEIKQFFASPENLVFWHTTMMNAGDEVRAECQVGTKTGRASWKGHGRLSLQRYYPSLTPHTPQVHYLVLKKHNNIKTLGGRWGTSGPKTKITISMSPTKTLKIWVGSGKNLYKINYSV